METTPPDACLACGGEEGAGARNGTARPRLHCTEDLCHQWGGIARRARPEKRAPSMRPTHTHLNRRVAPTSTAHPRAAPGPLAPPTPAAHAVPATHAERSAATAARATRPHRPPVHARSSRRPTPGPLVPPRPAAYAVPSTHAERCATPAARATCPHRPPVHARSSRRIAGSQRCHTPPRHRRKPPPQNLVFLVHENRARAFRGFSCYT